MQGLLKTGRIIYALGIIALGILCLIYKDFIVGRPPAWPAGFTSVDLIGYIGGAIIIISAIAVLFNKGAVTACLIIAGLILFLSVDRHIPQFMQDWANTYKAMALFGGSLVLAVSFYDETKAGTIPGWVSGMRLAGILLLAVFLIICGYAHFKYPDFVNTLIPSFIPFHSFWTYACGIFLFAGGLGLLIPVTRRKAALLTGIMIAGWFLLLHIPRVIADPGNISDRMGLFESFTFVGVFFVVAAKGEINN